MFLIVRGELTGSLSDLQQAIKLLKTSLIEAERFQRVASQIEILTMLARAQVALGDKQAKDTLLKALALAEPEGYRRLFLDMGAHLAELLQQCQTAQEMAGAYLPSPGFIGSLLEAIPRADGTVQAVKRVATQKAVPGIAETIDGLPISLSAREMEVLALIAEGKSNQQISAQLYLALNTVKRHVYNIYAKLGVEKRTQAILKARQLGLIP
jgi:LuxR family maltose regulon positive regulatory protein